MPEPKQPEEVKVTPKQLVPTQASIMNWSKGGKLVIAGGKKAKHPKSLWYDESLNARDLEENGETIFDIIMPWVKDK